MKSAIAVTVLMLGMISLSAQDKSRVKITTDFGDMIIKLYDDTPLHKANFLKNVRNGWLDGTLFHRVIPSFMMQGGDPNSIGASIDQSLGVDRCTKVPAEIRPNRFHKKGALSAARQPDGSNPDRLSSGCQFFIVQGYRHTDQQLIGLESQGRMIPAKQKAWYKALGGYPFLDGDYTVFGEVIEGMEVIELIAAMETFKTGGVKDRPIEDVKMTLTIIED